MDVDDALLKIGKFNRWRILIYSMVCTSVTFSGCWHMMSIVFTGGEPQHHCKLSENETLNSSIPLIPGKGRRWRHSQCTRYSNSSISNETIFCPNGWTYDRQEFDATIVTEWDLVCDKNYLVETSQSVFSFGVMVGAIVFTTLADHIGRKPVHLCCQYTMLILGLGIAFSGNYVTFVVLRFLQGAVREGAGLVGIVMACELFPAVHRTFAGTALELFWATAWMTLALIAYLIRDWRYLQVAITLPAIWTISLIWLLPESVPWLAANDRMTEAEEILRKAARYGGKQLPVRPIRSHRQRLTLETTTSAISSPSRTETSENSGKEINKEEGNMKTADGINCQKHPVKHNLELNGSKEDGEQKYASSQERPPFFRSLRCCPCPSSRDRRQKTSNSTQLSCLDIVKSPTMMLYSFIMCSLWFANGIIYFGLSLSTSTLAGDKYVNFLLSGVVEAPAYALTIVVLKRFGRRWPLVIFHLTAGVVLFANIFIPPETESGVELTPLVTTLTMIGKFAMTASFGTVVLYAPEIYPTNLRNFGFGLASVWGRIGGTIAPFFGYISKTNDWIPSVVFTIVALTTGFMALLLPETLDRPLPETIDEILSWKTNGGESSDYESCKNKKQKERR